MKCYALNAERARVSGAVFTSNAGGNFVGHVHIFVRDALQFSAMSMLLCIGAKRSPVARRFSRTSAETYTLGKMSATSVFLAVMTTCATMRDVDSSYAIHVSGDAKHVSLRDALNISPAIDAICTWRLMSFKVNN